MHLKVFQEKVKTEMHPPTHPQLLFKLPLWTAQPIEKERALIPTLTPNIKACLTQQILLCCTSVSYLRRCDYLSIRIRFPIQIHVVLK